MEYVNKRNELEKLIKSSNTQSNEDAIKKAQKTLDDNKIANTNESSSKDFEEKRKNIEEAINELKAAIEATKKSKN